MSQVRFIADLHFGHDNMAEKRGFQDTFYHDEHIIDRWNRVVNKKDLVYILGDVTMESSKYYYQLDRLKGTKVVILGNHDMKNHVPELLKYVDKVSGMMKYSRKGYPKMFLTHCPIHPMELQYRVGYNIHGHIHENIVKGAGQLPDKRYVCVSCEHVDYTPKLIEELNITPLPKRK